MNRYQAALIHLGFSALIFLGLLYLIVFVWYPQPYFSADGGWQGFRIIAAVGLILGPVLTLIVYRAGKRKLRFDLTVILLLQAAALSWGIWLVHDERTTLVAFADGSFYSLNRSNVALAGEPAKQLIDQADRLPAYAVVRLPDNAKEKLLLKLNIAAQGIPLYAFGERYAPLSPDTLPRVFADRLDLAGAAKTHPALQYRLQAFLTKAGGEASEYAFLPLECRFQHLVLALRRQDGAVAGTLDIDPATLPRARDTSSKPETRHP